MTSITTTITDPQTIPRAQIMHGMNCLDTANNPRVPILMQMVAALSRARTPLEVLHQFASGFARLYGPQAYVSLSTRGLNHGDYRITRLLTENVIDGMSRQNPWRNIDDLPVHNGGFFGEIVRQAYPEVIHNFYLEGDPVIGDALKDFGSLMAIPLFEDGEPKNWSITLRREPDGFSEQDLEDTILRANLGGATVRNVMMVQQLSDANQRIGREMHQIAAIQRALLPQKLPDIPGLSIGTSYEAYDTAGGDMYDFFAVDSDEDSDAAADGTHPWGMMIADASGHGPAAATIVAMLNAILYAAPREMRTPGTLLSFANRHLCAKRIEGRFVTGIIGRYDPLTRRLTYANAGHNPALLMNVRDGKVSIARLNEVGGIPLGVLDSVKYDDHTVQLEPGDTLVLYTDGIAEAMNSAGDMFGVEGIERSLTTCTGMPDCVIQHVMEAVRTHEAGQRPTDDQTIVVMRVDD